MHYQAAPHAEAKLVRCTRGAIYDVVVDLRPQSPTYKQWMAVTLTADKRNMVYVPEGCAHGFLTLADDTEVFLSDVGVLQPRVSPRMCGGMIPLSDHLGQARSK